MEVIQGFFVFLLFVFRQFHQNVSFSNRNATVITSNLSSIIPLQPRTIRQNDIAYMAKTNDSSDLKSVPVFVMEALLILLFSAAPSHLFYLLYDDTFKDPDLMLKAFSTKWSSSTVIKLTGDEEPLLNALADPLVLSSTSRRFILVFSSMQNIEILFRMISLKNLENPNTWWIVKTESEEDLHLLQGILREGSQVIAMQVEGLKAIKFFSSVIDMFGRIRFHLNGKWRVNSTYDIRNDFKSMFADPEEQYTNFNGRQLTVSVKDIPGILITKKMHSGELTLVSGYEVSLLKALSSALNFTMSLRKPPDGKWGGPTSNGSFDGMFLEVFRRNAHFAISSMSVTETENIIIDYTVPYNTITVTLLTQAPKEKSRILAAFSPFTPEVWISIVIITLVVGLIVTLQVSFSNKYLPEKVEGFAIDNVLFNVTGCLLKQINFLRAKGFTNTSLILWYIFALILSVLYSGMLTATLTKPSFEKPIDSLHDLPEAVAKGFTIVIIEGGEMEYMFKSASEGIYAETWKLFDRSKSFVSTPQEKIDKILTEKLTFVRGTLRAKYLAKEIGPHLVHVAREVFGLRLIVLRCFPGAPFTRTFDKVLQRMVEGGLVEKWLSNEFMKIPTRFTTEEDKGHEAFTVMQLQAAFYIILLGYALAGITLALELWFKRFT